MSDEGNTSERLTTAIGDTLTVDIVTRHAYRITFEANAGQVLTLSATTDQEEVDPIMVLLNADGETLTGDDDGGGLNALIADYTVPTDGTPGTS